MSKKHMITCPVCGEKTDVRGLDLANLDRFYAAKHEARQEGERRAWEKMRGQCNGEIPYFENCDYHILGCEGTFDQCPALKEEKSDAEEKEAGPEE